ncbi:hypothetical protein B566_EDAN003895 [Ephemera danica]|nr:hypothetical protein B566_EDAN003895 [Ephemera danica]
MGSEKGLSQYEKTTFVNMSPAQRPRNHASAGSNRKDPRKLAKKAAQASRDDAAPTSTTSGVVSPGNELGLVFPSADTAFKALLSARFCAAIWSNISDCDETFNYWEPTWEYSPKYALRSYSYILLHVLPALAYQRLLQPNRLLVFFFCRCLLGLLCAVCEAYFYWSVCKEFGIHVGRITLAFLVFSSGMFISSTAFLPSSFSMYMALLSLGAWYQRKYELAVLATALSAFLSWPFAALIGLPIAIDMLFRRKEWWRFTKLCGISVLFILLPMVKIDSDLYGRLVVAPFNIVWYNIFSGGGPDLYGTEPWYFYLLNGILNFNFLLAWWLVPCKPRNSACLPYWLSLSPLYLWLGVFFLQAHKEERFLFPIYPLVCLCGAVTLDSMQKLWFRLKQVLKVAKNNQSIQHYLKQSQGLALGVLIVCCTLGISRSLALYRGYHAPLDVYMEFSKLAPQDQEKTASPINVCVGKEWHRFPSSFFLPDNNWQLKYLESEFRGQLPQLFQPGSNGTSIEPPNFNDMNREEPSRYFQKSQCDYLVDFDSGRETEKEPRYADDTDNWELIHSIPFLNTERSPQFLRAFYVPYFTDTLCEYSSYYLLKAIHKKEKRPTSQR